jgi:hypothetical protein
MKKQVTTLILLAFVLVTRAQGPDQPTPPGIEERLSHTNEIIKKEITLTPDQQNAIDHSFKVFFEAADKLHKENPPPPPPPPDPKLKAALDKLIQERDASIQKALTPEQFEKFKEVEKKLHPDKKPGPPPPAN